ncbi:pentapeptide repeat-containing protein [uncultured Roseibium sp.]|uniref:pentapeptide repeat-containing protein n=1 Tax=uncultured Roseibium sp. TaxID=1936171 RepID=UPI0026105B7E|nr:pentapeptide repeat-containing protein [uncultured Roseibium sp.]
MGLISLIFAAGLFIYELRERQEERIARSWQLATTPAPGNSGKREALEYLNSQYGCFPDAIVYLFGLRCWKERTPLQGIDMSASANGGQVFLQGVNLSGANLEGANLSGANLVSADLSKSNANNANLSGADLSRATITWAHLRSANLRGATLAHTKLAFSDLSSANLSQAKLISADLFSVSLWFANLSGAHLQYVNLSDASLSQTKFDENTIFRIWAFRDQPPTAETHEIVRLVATRERDELWDTFHKRVYRDRPDLRWPSTPPGVTVHSLVPETLPSASD